MSDAWKNQYIDLIHSKPNYIISYNRTSEAMDRTELARRVAHFEHTYCEIGSGSGGHLIERAALDPQSLFVGIELRFKRVYRTAEKAEARGLNNIIIVKTDAKRIAELFPNESLDGIYLNFPDPWDKRRWRKHRLLTAEYLAVLHRILKPHSFFSFKTDHQTYFKDARQTLDSTPLFSALRATDDLYKSEFLADNVPTEFEKLFRSKGLPVGHLLYKRI